MSSNARKTIAVFGATGQQGSAVVRALQDRDAFKVRALTRDPAKHRALAEEVVEANLDRPESTRAALGGAHGVFLVTNFWQPGKDERGQAASAVRAAKDAGVKHFIWSTLPDAEAISGGRFPLPHFSGKAKIDGIVREAEFAHHTFVVAPFYYQNLLGVLAPQKLDDGSLGWALPIDPKARGIAMGDIEELGRIVAGAFEKPERAGHGAYLPLVGDILSFGDIVETLNHQGHAYSFRQMPRDAYASLFPGAAGVAETFAWFEAHSYLGSDWTDRMALACEIAGKAPTPFAAWARTHLPSTQLERSIT
jgi:uncharacterized protein YbjT (DUF2867 family)